MFLTNFGPAYNPLCENKLVMMNRSGVLNPTGLSCKPCIEPQNGEEFGECCDGRDLLLEWPGLDGYECPRPTGDTTLGTDPWVEWDYLLGAVGFTPIIPVGHCWWDQNAQDGINDNYMFIRYDFDSNALTADMEITFSIYDQMPGTGDPLMTWTLTYHADHAFCTGAVMTLVSAVLADDTSGRTGNPDCYETPNWPTSVVVQGV